MDLKTRAQNIITTPNTEWPVIEKEQTSTGELLTGYVMPLAAIGAIAGLIGGSLVGTTIPFVGTYRAPLMVGLTSAVFVFVMAIIGVLILSFIINALAPTFGGQQNSMQAMKVAVYSYTPAWIAGVLNIFPPLSVLAVLAGLYGIYLLYLGLPHLMKAPQDKAVGYTAVVLVCAIVLSVVIGVIGGLMMAPATMAGLAGSGTSGGDSGGLVADPNSALGKLEALGKSLEQSTQKMESAQKAGDTAGQTAAALEAMGTLFGGGRRVEPVSLDQLVPLVPDTFAGLAKQSSNSERSGIAGLMVATAEATYGDNSGKSVDLEITDTGGASGLMGLASWAGVMGEKENDQVSERTERVGGRLVHRSASKTGGTNEFAIVLGERFIVTAKGNGVDVNALQAAVSSLNLAKLESMKDVGVQK